VRVDGRPVLAGAAFRKHLVACYNGAAMLKRILISIAGLLLAAFAALHWWIPDIFEANINTTIPHSPYAISEKAQQLHEQLFIADLHTDSLLWKRDLLRRSDVGHVDLPRLQAGNVALQVFSATTKSPSGQNYESNDADSDNITALALVSLWPARTWDSLFERAVFQLEKLLNYSEESDGQLMVIRHREDMQEMVSARERGKKVIGGLFLIEGAHPLQGDINNLQRLYDKGLRIVGITHFFDNELGGSLHGQSGAPLTVFGKEVVARANELGMIIDIAHASPAVVKDILELSDRPTILSHGGFKGVCDKSRNLEDALMKAFAAKGGIIGVGYWDGAVCDATPGGVVRAIRYGIDLLGVDHIALGSDYDGGTAVSFDTSELAILTQKMLDQQFTEEEIRKVMGGNVRDFMLEQLPSAISKNTTGEVQGG
jgi:membrane dipeptidase